MDLRTGILLKSTEALKDSIFNGVIVLITEYNQNGAIGFVVNKRFGRSLNELEEFRHSPDIPLYDGGPVDKEHLFFIHQRPDMVDEGTQIGDEIYFGGNFQQAVRHINNGVLSPTDIKIFVGYCGWDKGELEEEIIEGSWLISNDSRMKDIFR